MEPIASVVAHTILWSATSTLVVMVPGVLLAYCLARYEFPGRDAVATVASLPLVLPPTAIGYLLLRALADDGPLGRESLAFDLDVLLTWRGVVVACAIMSFPLVVRTARVSFEEVDPRLEAIGRTLGYGPAGTFLKITLPLAGRGLVAAAILGFTRAMGEFGATVTVAGSIPGRTRTLASAIFTAQQAGDEARATALVVVALAVGFGAVFLAEWLSRPGRRKSSTGDGS